MHYTHYSEIYAAVMELLRKIPGVTEVDVDSTGGGLYAITVKLGDGSFFLLTDTDGLDWERKDAECWTLGHYLADGEWDESFAGSGNLFTPGLVTDEAAVALVTIGIAAIPDTPGATV